MFSINIVLYISFDRDTYSSPPFRGMAVANSAYTAYPAQAMTAPMTQYLRMATLSMPWLISCHDAQPRATHSKLIPTDPDWDKIVDVVANTPVPTILFTIKNTALTRPNCRP